MCASATLRSHERTLDFRAGVLRRRAEWVSPAGQQVRVSSVRLVSFVQRAVAAVLYEVEPLDAPARLVVQSELVANEPMPAAAADPRARADLGGVALRAVLRPRRPRRAGALTRKSALRMAAGMDHSSLARPGPRRRPRAARTSGA